MIKFPGVMGLGFYQDIINYNHKINNMRTSLKLQATSFLANMCQILKVVFFTCMIISDFKTGFCFHAGVKNETFHVKKLANLKDAIQDLLGSYNRTHNHTTITPVPPKTTPSKQSGNGLTAMTPTQNATSNVSEDSAGKCPIHADPRKSQMRILFYWLKKY